MSRKRLSEGCHTFQPPLIPLSILLPKYGDLSISFAQSKVTSDYIWDYIEECWPEWEANYRPSTLLINQDNGPENHSRRTQFMKRAVDFVNRHRVHVKLAYYPPYHSKYNPVERTHGALDQYWNGMLLTDVATTINIAKNMTWKGRHPIVTLVTQVHETGVKSTKQAMAAYEKAIHRLPGLDRWFIDISPSPAELGN